MLVSVLMPSRNRWNSLVDSINSLINNASNPKDIEFLIRLDDDDGTNKPNELRTDINKEVIIGSRLSGYKSLHVYINELCAISKGTFLFLFNDDCRMFTKGWDDVIRKYQNQVCILNIRKNDDILEFPVVHRKYYETLGHFSLSPHNDSWILRLPGIINDKQCEIQHSKPGDVTFQESSRAYNDTVPQFWSAQMQQLLKEDIQKMNNFFEELKKNENK